jgi:hypothetical protein
MKKLCKAVGTIAILAALVLSFAACDDLLDSTSGNKIPDQPSGTNTYTPMVYTSYDADGTEYKLTITRSSKAAVQFTPATGDSYTMTITTTAGITQTSSGTVNEFSGNKFTLTASINVSMSFEVTISDNAITNITGSITVEGGITVIGPGSLPPNNGFVAATGITGVPSGALIGTPLALSGTVAPDNATNKTIAWSVKSAGITGAAISGNTLTATTAGSVTVTATITNGKTATTPYTQDFAITITGGSGDNDPLYIITGSGTPFTASKAGTTVGTANQTIQNTINAIRTDASGKNPVIQFGNNGNELNIGTANASFNNSGGTWGAVTLKGKISSAVNNNDSSTINIGDSVSVTSMADIKRDTAGAAISFNSTGTLSITGGTVSTLSNGVAISHNSSGTVSIGGGTVSATSGYAVYNNHSGAVNISGGTVSATTGYAVYNNYTGKITVSGTAKVTSVNTNSSQGTIYLKDNGSATTTRLEITGGTIKRQHRDPQRFYRRGKHFRRHG